MSLYFIFTVFSLNECSGICNNIDDPCATLCKLKQNFLLCSVKSIELFFSEINFVSHNLCVVLSPRIKIYFFWLSTCAEEPISTPNIITFLPNPLATENIPRLSSLIPYREYLYLSMSAFLNHLAAPNKEFSNVG